MRVCPAVAWISLALIACSATDAPATNEADAGADAVAQEDGATIPDAVAEVLDDREGNETSAGDSSSADSSVADGTSPDAGACEDDPSQLAPCDDADAGSQDPSCVATIASACELAATPRCRPDLELLAMGLSGGMTADPLAYGRLLRDTTSFAAQLPELAALRFRARFDGTSVFLVVDAATQQSMLDGTYDAWDCLNAAYGPVQVTPSGSWGVRLVFPGIYDTELLATQEYAHLPGVLHANPNWFTGCGDRTICLTPQGDTWYYWIRGDDCDGCSPQQPLDHLFKTEASGAVELLDSWGECGPPAPDHADLGVEFHCVGYGSPD